MAYEVLDHPFLHRLREQVLYTAGPIGSTLLSLDLGLEKFTAFAGTDREETHDECLEWLNISSPETLELVFDMFYAAGCDGVDSCSFGGNKAVLSEFGLEGRTSELNRIAAEVIGKARDRYSTPEWPRYSLGTIGSGTRLPSLGQASWDELVDSYFEQASGLLEGGIDVLKVETCQDLLQAKAALAACSDAMAAAGRRVPVIASVTIESTGTMLLGSDIGAALTTLEAVDTVDVLGINCATGPAEMLEHARFLAEHSRRPVFIGPNAGIPEIVDGQASYALTPSEFARFHRIFVEEFGINIAAGCCGTTPEMFRAAIDSLGHSAPLRRPAASQFFRKDKPADAHESSVSSLYAATPIKQETSFLVVGERLNAIGSRAFKDVLLAEDVDGMVAIARDQAALGAHVLDVMVDYVGRDGSEDMERATTALRTQSTLPLMFDSTEPDVIEAALKLYGGKAIVNSIKLEGGERPLEAVLPIIRRHGAAAVAMTIDEEGQARTADWKVRVAKRIYDIAVGRFGMEPSDLLFDCLTLTITTGQEETRRDAIETLDAVGRIKEEIPEANTILGVSNCSFGLKPAARRVLNSVFLSEAVDRGLDAAIVNARQIMPLNRIPEVQLEAALDLIYDRRRPDHDPLGHFVSLFEAADGSRKKAAEADREALSVEDRLKARIVEGDRKDIEKDLDEALDRFGALKIVNDFLLDGMRMVGDLFGSGRLQLPFVLQSAETMKYAVAHLEPHMERADGQAKGKIVLATVRGDVHDIGKNLADIILTNNGYQVHNLGIKQPIANVITKAEEIEADAIGLSGLLVKSTVVMREDLEELNARELSHYPVLLGGAALTRKYVDVDLQGAYEGSVYYCQDAFEGLAAMDSIVGAGEAGKAGGSPSEIEALADSEVGGPAAEFEYVRSVVRDSERPPIPVPPFWGSRVIRGLPLRNLYPYINEVALFRGQWGYRKGSLSDQDYRDVLEHEAEPAFRRFQEEAIAKGLLLPQVVYGYFPVIASGNSVLAWPDVEDGRAVGDAVRFEFPRQPSGQRLCIADFFLSAEEAGWAEDSAQGPATFDTLACHVVTVGPRASERAQELFAGNEYKEYLQFHGFTVETAEALAEFWHKRIREELGIAGDDSTVIRELFRQKYRGSRYSFGYPACPDLEQQAGIAELLDPSRVGCELGETFQWHPEQTTSAIVVHHPTARYFTIR